MKERVEKQLEFALEIEKVKIFLDRHIYLDMLEMRMMQNIALLAE